MSATRYEPNHSLDPYTETPEQYVPKYATVPETTASIQPDFLRLPDEIESQHAEIGTYIKSRFVGQTPAIDAVIGALDRGVFRTDDRPLASILFLGPTGTGKTELTKVLTEALEHYGTPTNRLHLDCTTLQDSHEASPFLLGSPAGYLGYRDKAFFDSENFATPGSNEMTILVLDEMEKAHDALFEVLMPALDEGTIRLKNGTQTSLARTIVIATSNVGAAEMNKQLQPSVGFTKSADTPSTGAEGIESAAIKGLQSRFSHIPEFLARFSDRVVFQPHTRGTLGEVMKTLVESRNLELRRRFGREIFLADGTLDYLLDSVQDRAHEGARALRSAYEQIVENQFGRYVAGGHLPEGYQLYIQPTETTIQTASSSSTPQKKLAFYAVKVPGLFAEPEYEPEPEPETSTETSTENATIDEDD